MPPKDKGSKKGAAKAKALAEEQARLAEEARKAEEAEIARLEEEAKLEAELQARRAEEEKKRQAEEEAKLAAEREEDGPFTQTREERILELQAAVAEQEEWVKYLLCNPLPDVEKESSLNTYLSMAREADKEDLLQNPHTKMPQVPQCDCS